MSNHVKLGESGPGTYRFIVTKRIDVAMDAVDRDEFGIMVERALDACAPMLAASEEELRKLRNKWFEEEMGHEPRHGDEIPVQVRHRELREMMWAGKKTDVYSWKQAPTQDAASTFDEDDDD